MINAIITFTNPDQIDPTEAPPTRYLLFHTQLSFHALVISVTGMSTGLNDQP